MLAKKTWHLSSRIAPKTPKTLKWLKLHFMILNTSLLTSWKLPLSVLTAWSLFCKLSTRSIGWQLGNTLGRNPNTPLRISKFSKLDETYPLPEVNKSVMFSNYSSTWPLFLQNWNTFRPKSTLIYKTNRDFRLLFLSDSTDKSRNSLVSAKRYFSRWLDAYNLLFNVFYVEAQIQLLSNKLFIEEALVFNWNYNLRNYKIFKYVQPFFTFKDAPHGGYIHSAVLDILLQKLDLTIVVDIRNHKKLLGYLQKYGLFSIGLVPTNYSPWVVSYPIPTFSDSPVSQYYFLRLLFFIRGSATAKKYNHTKSCWNSLSKHFK